MVILGQNQPRISPDLLVVCVAMILPGMRPQRQVGSWIVISRKFDLGFWILDLDYFFNPCLRSSLNHNLPSCTVPAAAGSLARRRRAAAAAAAAVGRGSGRPAGGRRPQACAAEGRRSAAEGRAKKTCFPGRRPAAEGRRPQAEGRLRGSAAGKWPAPAHPLVPHCPPGPVCRASLLHSPVLRFPSLDSPRSLPPRSLPHLGSRDTDALPPSHAAAAGCVPRRHRSRDRRRMTAARPRSVRLVATPGDSPVCGRRLPNPLPALAQLLIRLLRHLALPCPPPSRSLALQKWTCPLHQSVQLILPPSRPFALSLPRPRKPPSSSCHRSSGSGGHHVARRCSSLTL